MSKAAIYEAALKQMAEGGNEQAKLVLGMAQNIPDAPMPDVKEAVAYIRGAVEEHRLAIQCNATRWQSSTDNHISLATNRLMSALSCLIK